MAEVLVNVLLERLATITLDKVGGEFKLVTGVEKEVKSLTRNLEAIQAVLEDAEQRQVTEATVRRWLSELTEVSFDMDDVLDEWITEVLKQQMEKQEKQGENALIVTTKKKVCFPFFSSCFCFGRVNQLMLRHDIAVRIKDLNERVASIGKEKQDFSFQNITRVSELPERQKTTSLPNVKTFGRDKEKSLIASKLLSESSEGNEVPLIIPIVGMGGMGKTTLAQLVYNDENVKSHFDKRIWVCVSDPFEEIKIAQAIIEEIDKDNTSKNSNVLQTLTQCIYKLLEGKKFLIVLDDVWSPNSDQWEELIKPLRHGALGSRVLVTTRKEEVATLMKATTQMIPLRELGEAFCLSLFYYNADMNESSVPKEFEVIALEIVKRCNGLPLAAKTLGSLMRNKRKIHEWRDVLNSKTWELEKIQQDVFRPLLLSYHDLTPATKRCLLYCVTFPKDYVYNRNRLIELWMSQDYLNAKESKEKIVVGQNYFDDLAMRSFFQDIKVNDKYEYEYECGNIKCKIHDIVHDFLQYLTKNECLILDFELDASEGRDVSKDKVHHLTLVHATGGDSLKSFLPNYKKLRSLIATQSSIGPIYELIVQLKCLRTLSLCGWWAPNSLKEIPETIGGLIHLRYLDLSDNRELEELPSALGSLYNLQTLRLVGCERLKKVDVRRLINLRHLYVRGCRYLNLIKGIEKLTDLQRLDEFHVGDGDEGNKLEDLKDLNQLQGRLPIWIKGNQNMAENAAIMVNKAHLLQLSLFFPLDSDEGEDREIMNGLEPHPGLESLDISSYGGGAFSHWLSYLHSLRVLTLTECWNCGFLPPLGKLASLESLEIWKLDGVSKVGVEFLGIGDDGQTSSSSIFISFPNLKQLTFREMVSWEEWEGVENNNNNITIMPCLSQLTIYSCKKLKALPDFLWKTPLQKLHIWASPTLENLYRQGIGEEWAKISHIPTIKIGA
ncbi:putative disease resistance protein RGA3 [Rosa sericea]